MRKEKVLLGGEVIAMATFRTLHRECVHPLGD